MRGRRERSIAPAAGDGLPQGSEPVELDPASFTADIDNRYWPMEPGTRWTYREVDEEGKEVIVVITVSSETKEIANGITARVVRDSVTEDGELIEDTFDWYAQDADGNVWYLGEDTAEFKDGKVKTTAGSWEARCRRCAAGNHRSGNPGRRHDVPAGVLRRRGRGQRRVLAVGEQVEVPAGHYADALVTQDTTALKPDVVEYKFYGPTSGPCSPSASLGAADAKSS